MELTKATRFQIIKPLDATWDEFGQVLRDLSYHTTKMCNAAIQLYWEYHNYRLAHKNATGKYPDAAMDKEKYGCSFRNYVYRHLTVLPGADKVGPAIVFKANKGYSDLPKGESLHPYF